MAAFDGVAPIDTVARIVEVGHQLQRDAEVVSQPLHEPRRPRQALQRPGGRPDPWSCAPRRQRTARASRCAGLPCHRDPAPGIIAVDIDVLLPRRKCSLASTTSTSRPSCAARSAATRPPPAPTTTRSVSTTGAHLVPSRETVSRKLSRRMTAAQRGHGKSGTSGLTSGAGRGDATFRPTVRRMATWPSPEAGRSRPRAWRTCCCCSSRGRRRSGSRGSRAELGLSKAVVHRILQSLESRSPRRQARSREPHVPIGHLPSGRPGRSGP